MTEHTTRDGYTYELYGDYGIPKPPTPSEKEVKEYMADRRYVRDNYDVAHAYYDAWRTVLNAVDTLEGKQRTRYSKARQALLEKLEKKRTALYTSDAATIAGKHNDACQRIQQFRQTYYGAWFGPRSRKHYADNYMRSYGVLVTAVFL